MREIIESEDSKIFVVEVFSKFLGMGCLVFIFLASIEEAIKSSPNMSGVRWISGLFIVFLVCGVESRCCRSRDKL